MTDIQRFDPFNNRLCRNVRNALSEGFKEALDKQEMQPVQRMAGFFLDDLTPSVVRAYIEKRLTAYAQVLTNIRDQRLEAPMAIAIRIWDHGLFRNPRISGTILDGSGWRRENDVAGHHPGCRRLRALGAGESDRGQAHCRQGSGSVGTASGPPGTVRQPATAVGQTEKPRSSSADTFRNGS